MKYARLGSSGLKVGRIALGCMSFGDHSQMGWTLDDAGAEPIFRQAVELGITFWDTANIYGKDNLGGNRRPGDQQLHPPR